MEKILIIEDDELIRENMSELFVNEGYEVFTAANGKLGLEKAKCIVPELIISDIMMPEMDGFQVFKEMRDNPQLSAIPFIFLSALSDKTNHRFGMSMGADDYITKPFLNSELLDVVRNRIRKSKFLKKNMEELKLNLMNTVPHEFFTPLNAVLGFSQLLIEAAQEKTVEKEEVLEYSEYINNAGKILLRLTKNYVFLSELTMLTEGNEPIKAEISEDVHLSLPVLISALAKDAKRDKDLFIDLEAVSLKIGDTYLQKIIEELLGNAIKFSDENSKILVRGTRKGSVYKFTIQDFGIGMNMGDIQKIDAFTQFQRTKLEQSGLGLGLAIVKKILKFTNGELEVESEKGKGTKITIKIPIFS